MKEECCPKFNPSPWNKKEIKWKKKKFIKEKVFTIFYMPINFGGVMQKVMKKLENAKAKCLQNMGLSYHTSPWNMEVYIAVDKKIPNSENTEISGKFLSKVYEGPYKDTKKWCNDFSSYAKSKGKTISKMYMWYTTCPICAKKWGKNYVVILGEYR
ncbi:MAG: hydrolase [Candidatus Micrarchaeota archaeon]